MQNKRKNSCKIIIWLLVIAVFLWIFFVGGLLSNTVIVTFDSNGGSNVRNQIVLSGSTIAEPNVPVAPTGTEFVGWYNNDTLWNFTEDKVTSDITLKARWNWNGETADYNWFIEHEYATTEDFYINNGAELYALANLVRGETTGVTEAPVDFLGKKIILTNDIYINGYEWTPIGTETIPFRGDFDGENHTISGLTITDQNTHLTGWDAALFGYITGDANNYVDFYDLNLTNVNIDLNLKDGNNYTGAAVAGFIGYANISNVTASGRNHINTDTSTVAGIFVVNENAIKMENIVNNVELTGTRYSATTTGTAYFIMGGIVGQTTGDGPFYYKKCVNNAKITMNNPFAEDLTVYIGNYTPETIAGHIVGQASGSDASRLVFDNCSKSANAIINGAHSYLIQAKTGGYDLVYAIQSVFQGKRYTSVNNTVDYGYTHISGDTDLSFRYGNETLYFVPTNTEFNLETINTDYLRKNDTGFVQKPNCFYLPNIATETEDIKAIAGGKWLVSYSSGSHAIIYTYDK